MTTIDGVALVLTVLLLGYLFAVLLRPEDFS